MALPGNFTAASSLPSPPQRQRSGTVTERCAGRRGRAPGERRAAPRRSVSGTATNLGQALMLWCDVNLGPPRIVVYAGSIHNIPHQISHPHDTHAVFLLLQLNRKPGRIYYILDIHSDDSPSINISPAITTVMLDIG
ncbi:hypothetical protein J6590_051659 [Homalodisca vitripennis]|nr:hypothetical protein J6590_051659 [Homalodisca vitripennis]